MLYAIDVDGTLCEDQFSWWEYEKAVPIIENIEKINKLFDDGHQVILYTSRREENRQVTLEWLEQNQVKYHGIIFDKFRADCYVDSCAKRMEEVCR